MFGITLQKLTIRTKIIALGIVLAVLLTSNFLVVLYYESIFEEVEQSINVISSNKAFAQQVALYANLVKEGKTEARKYLKEALEKHEATVQAMKVGGISTPFNTQLIPVPTEVLPAFNLSQNLWEKYSRQAEIILNENIFIDSLSVTELAENTTIQRSKTLNPRVAKAIQFLNDNAPEMLAKDSEIVRGYIAHFQGIKAERRTVNFVLYLVNLIFIVLAYLFINSHILKPLDDMLMIEQYIAEGTFDCKIPHKYNDEIGRVVESVNTLFKDLQNATDFITSMGEGNLNVEYQTLHSNLQKDKLGLSLLEMRNKLLEAAENDRQRNWIAEGLAKFADILRKESDNPDFNYILIANLVKYLNANQGGLFIVNDDNPQDIFMEMIACYAFEKKKYVTKRVNKGEGLVGTVYQEGSTMYLTEVPQDYINITSGLGEANPRSILIVPFRLNNDVYGIVELASFEEFKPYQIEFVEKLGESIASTFSTLRSKAKTQKLLEESLLLSEKMKAQEEEMRQNLEELVATQEEVQRKNKLMEEQKARLEEALEQQIKRNELLKAEQEQIKENLAYVMRIQQEQQNRIEVLMQQKQDLERQLLEQRQVTEEARLAEQILRRRLEEKERA
ncbi:MAG: GAF domain-containing protein [Microscillaceae bacterium]|nr:GAF domain-containing protein [Microscillaceae bacterium]MDW8460189.1 GAF domain-containing protein [Cytophagales bacterium]